MDSRSIKATRFRKNRNRTNQQKVTGLPMFGRVIFKPRLPQLLAGCKLTTLTLRSVHLLHLERLRRNARAMSEITKAVSTSQPLTPGDVGPGVRHTTVSQFVGLLVRDSTLLAADRPKYPFACVTLQRNKQAFARASARRAGHPPGRSAPK